MEAEEEGRIRNGRELNSSSSPQFSLELQSRFKLHKALHFLIRVSRGPSADQEITCCYAFDCNNKADVISTLDSDVLSGLVKHI